MKKNYQKELDMFLSTLDASKKVPTLLLHSCCAPCSSYVLEYLSNYFSITVFYYNPNITDQEEYDRRKEEQRRLISELETVYPIRFLPSEYNAKLFFHEIKGLEKEPEGGARCEQCFEMRLTETGKVAEQLGFDFFTTTLTISPMKDAQLLNEIGERIASDLVQTTFLHSDFKKKNGYKRSVELSSIYNLYRQDYCGCVFSKRERELQKQQS